MKLPAFVVAVLFLAFAAPASAQPKKMRVPVSHPELRFIGEQVELNLKARGGRSLVAVKIGDAGPFDFFIDTGASVSVIDSRIAADLGLPVVGKTQVGAPGGKQVDATIVSSAPLHAGDLEIRDATMVTLEIAELTGGLMQGILGLDIFQDVLLTLDPHGAKAIVSRGALTAGDPGVVQLDTSQGRVQFQMMVAGQSMKTQVDTGAPNDFTFPIEAIDTIPTLDEPEQQAQAGLVGGVRNIRLRKLDGLISVAGIEFQNPQIGFMDPSPGMAHIGAGIMDTLILTLDQRNSLLQFRRLEPTAAAQPKPAQRRLGVRFRGMGTSAASFTHVASVNPGSLGEKSGFLPGDELVSLNGKPMSSYNQAALGSLIWSDEPLEWVVERDGTRHVIEIP